MKFSLKNKWRWLIVCADMLLFALALLLAYLMRFDWTSDFEQVYREWDNVVYWLPIYFGVKLLVYLIFKVQKHIIRHTSSHDVLLLLFINFITSIIYLFVGIIRHEFYDGLFMLPTAVLILEFFFASMLMTSARFVVKLYYLESIKKHASPTNILIYGAGIYGLTTKRTIERERTLEYNIVGFLDDNRKIRGNFLEGLPIFHTSTINKVLVDKNIGEVVLAMQQPNPRNQSRIINHCLAHNVKVRKVPSFSSWINGSFSSKQIKTVKIEDLLGRAEIQLDKDKIHMELFDKVVLVSGAAGSIGSEMVRQMIHFHPKKIILLDCAESAMYDFVNDLNAEHTSLNIEVVIGDIRYFDRMKSLFEKWKPDYVLHAAAYKHVPLMEHNPLEAIQTNIYGTKNLVDLACQYNTKKFVMISTDKAVNPTSVMGASKRIAEMYAQYKNDQGTTQFVTTRFGNVIGSNGSVIPLFRKQIERGGPITVTDPEVTRYFMTIPEACQLVLEAGAIGHGGEVFVFDMGKSVKIIDIAKKMIKLSGLELNKDIQIKFVGLRPGEKLYEELLIDKEITLPTHHPKIMRAKVHAVSDKEIALIEKLVQDAPVYGTYNTVAKLKEILPEFKSNNSIFEQIDHQKSTTNRN